MRRELLLMKEKIIVALDVSTKEAALELVDNLKDEVGAFKIGMQLYNSEGPEIIRLVQNKGDRVFLDLKFHDIPNTVAETAGVIAQKGVFMFNVHAAGGYKMMAEAAKRARQVAAEHFRVKPLILAVTVLTSISPQVFQEELGYDHSIQEQVVSWAKLAQAAGLDGVVASPQEISAVRDACGEDFVIVTPGIRPLWAATNDQERIMTPAEAIAAGANYLVIGRPITAQPDPAAAARRIAEEIAAGQAK